MDYGLTIKRPDNSSQEVEGFQSPVPSFIPSPLAKKLSLFEIIEPNRSPALTVHDAKLAELMDKVRKRPDFTPIEFKESKSRAPSIAQSLVKAAPIKSSIDDETFIRKTRAGTNLHDPEIKTLFHQAGGANYLVSGLSYAQAFESMRRVILKRIAEKNKTKQVIAPYQRCLSSNIKSSMTPGMPTQEEFIARDNAMKNAKERLITERWLRNQFPKKKQ